MMIIVPCGVFRGQGYCDNLTAGLLLPLQITLDEEYRINPVLV